MCMCVCVFTYVCTYTWRPELTLRVIPQALSILPFLLLSQGLLLAWNSSNSLGWLASEPRDLLVSASPTLGS